MKNTVTMFLNKGGFITAIAVLALALTIFLGLFAGKLGYYADYRIPVPAYAQTGAFFAVSAIISEFILMIITGIFDLIQKSSPKWLTVISLLIIPVCICSAASGITFVLA